MSRQIALPDFLILLSKLRNRKFNPTGIGDEGDGLVAVLICYYIVTIFPKEEEIETQINTEV